MVGIVPSNWLFLKEIVVMSVMTPNPPGRVPSSLFPSRLRVPIDVFIQNGETEIAIRFVVKRKCEKKSFETVWKERQRKHAFILGNARSLVETYAIPASGSMSLELSQ